MGTHKLLEVSNLSVEFETYGGVVKAVRGVDFSVDAGEVLAHRRRIRLRQKCDRPINHGHHSHAARQNHRRLCETQGR
jgi:hypothetical protein